MATRSLWLEADPGSLHAPLDRDLAVDVAVVGGGVTGASTAYLLKRAGLKVVLLERERCGGGNTGHTSAHLTHVMDLRVSKLIDRLGHDHAAAVWDAGNAAIQQIESIAHREGIDCNFTRVPGFIAASLVDGEDERDTLKEEAKLAVGLGFPASYVESTPLFRRPGIRFPNQARFHPRKYLRGLVDRISGDACHVFENTGVEEIAEDPPRIKANGRTVSAGHVVIATDVPLQGAAGLIGATLLQTKIMPYTSYVIGAKVRKGAAPDALIWDTYDPYHFYRLAPGDRSDHVVFGGADHKTGQNDDPVGCFERLESLLRRYLPEAECDHRWSGQVIEAVDGLPFIGETAPRQFAATGFSGNGLTFGTLAAMMARDWVAGTANPWSDLFAPTRKKLGALWNYLTENIDYPYYMVKDRLRRSEGESVESVTAGAGRILKIDGQRVAVYRDGDGRISTMTAVCPHMGCIVHWNDAEKTWDCPCHGSRFHATGEVRAGPAESNLESVRIPLESR